MEVSFKVHDLWGVIDRLALSMILNSIYECQSGASKGASIEEGI